MASSARITTIIHTHPVLCNKTAWLLVLGILQSYWSVKLYKN